MSATKPDELKVAFDIATRVLERPGIDPGCDEAIVARQLVQTVENAARHLLQARSSHVPTMAARVKYLWRLFLILDPEGCDEGRYGSYLQEMHREGA